MRRIRKNIRQAAKDAGLSTDEYRQIHGYSTDWIRRQAGDLSGNEGLVTTRTRSTKAATSRHKPYDGVSSKPLYSSLNFGKPIIRIAHGDFLDLDWVVRLAENGHYMPERKIYRDGHGEARSINEGKAA